MLNSAQSVVEVVDRFAIGAHIQVDKKWAEGDVAYNSRPQVNPGKASTETAQAVNYGQQAH